VPSASHRPNLHLEGGTHGGMQSSSGGTHGAPAYVNNVVTPWLCTWVALLLLLPHPTHTRAKKATREMTGRASDGSDSYSYIWSVAACGSAISGEASCAAEG
jgi:hypothetical protein